MKNSVFNRLTSMVVAVGLVIGHIPLTMAAAQAETGTQAAPMVSQPVVQALPGEKQVLPTVTPAEPPADETPAEKKARLKAEKQAAKEAEKARKMAEKAEAKRLKDEEKARKLAERKKNGGGSKAGKIGKAVLGCALGGLAGGLLAGKKNRGKGILAGCVLGAGVGLAFASLSKKDNEELSSYVEEDFLLQDESCSRTWQAPESKQNVQISCGETTYVNANHKFFMEEDVVLDTNDFKVAEAMKYSTASLRLRASPNTSSANNVVGGYSRGDKLRTYGTTNDGKWTYVVDKLPDGSYELLGYVASSYLSDKAPSPVARKQTVATLQPAKGKTNRAAAQRAASPANASAKPAKQQQASLSTRCKSVNVSVGSESKSAKSCAGSGYAFLFPNSKTTKRTV